MKKLKIIFSDSLHFHERNFNSLFNFIKQNNIEHSFMNPKKPMLSAFGNYDEFKDDLQKYKFNLDGLSAKELLFYEYKGINIFELCKSEMLSYLLPRKNWRMYEVPNTSDFVIEKAYNENVEELILNMSSGLYWIDFWSQELKRHKIHDFCCIFSGSNTYSKSLINILKTHVTNPILMESFFTGNEYYMEFKYESLPNNSDLRFKNIFNSYELPESSYEYNKLKAKAINKVITAKNKNVEQPELETSRFNLLPDSYFLISGQVLNDYSIIDTQKQLNSIEQYKKIIDVLLRNTNEGIVFKAHPWEQQKNNIKFALTFQELSDYRKTLPKVYRDRVFILNHINLNKLISDAHGFITICSQSAFEAAFQGLKPITIGGAFFDNYGFTSSFDSCSDFESALKNKNIKLNLDLNEFESFERYLVVTLCFHLVCVHNSGFIRLREIFDKKMFIPIVNQKKRNSIVVDNTSNQTEVLNIEKKDLINKKETDFKTLVDIDPAVNKLANTINSKTQSFLKETFSETNVIIKLEDILVKNIGSTRLYRKYRNKRTDFFEDVNNPIVKKYWEKVGNKF